MNLNVKLSLFFLFLLTLSFRAWAGGDVVVLNDGTEISGNIIAQAETTDLSPQKRSILFNSHQVWIDTPDGLKKVDTSDIKQIRFGPRAAATLPPASPSPAAV
jgi:hypothetical protein